MPCWTPRSTFQTWCCLGCAKAHCQYAYKLRTRVFASHWNKVRWSVVLRCVLRGGDAHCSCATTMTHWRPCWHKSNCPSGPCSYWSHPTFVRSKAMPTSPPLAKSIPWKLRSPNHSESLGWEQCLLCSQCPSHTSWHWPCRTHRHCHKLVHQCRCHRAARYASRQARVVKRMHGLINKSKLEELLGIVNIVLVLGCT